MAKEPTVFNFGEDTQLREAPDGRLYIEDRDGNPKTIDSLSTGELRGDWDRLVTTDDDLSSVLASLSDDEIVQLVGGTHTIDNWLDIDGVTGATIRGVGSTMVKVADGANVGGFRLGSSSAVSDITIENISFHGNANNQDQTVKRLHAWIFENATNCTVRNCYGTRTSPYHEHNSGGTVYTCRSQAADITFIDCVSDDTGDRGFQLAGSGHRLIRPVTRNGYDRAVSLDVQLPDGSWDGADDVIVRDGDFRDNSNGSCVATAEYAASECQVVNCKMYGTFRGVVQFDHNNCANNLIAGNHAYHTGQGDSQPSIVPGIDGTVVGNHIEETASAGWSDGVYCHSTHKNVTVTGNTIILGDGAKSGINLLGASSEAKDNRIIGFGSGGSGAGVRVNSTNCHVTGNTGTTDDTPRAWIAWDDASGVCAGNYSYGSGYTHYDYASTPDIERDNFPVSYLLDATVSVASGGTTTQTISGASVGDEIEVDVTPANDPGNDVGFAVDKVWYDTSAGAMKVQVSETEGAGGGSVRITAARETSA